jgi:hypothetical protein
VCVYVQGLRELTVNGLDAIAALGDHASGRPPSLRARRVWQAPYKVPRIAAALEVPPTPRSVNGRLGIAQANADQPPVLIHTLDRVPVELKLAENDRRKVNAPPAELSERDRLVARLSQPLEHQLLLAVEPHRPRLPHTPEDSPPDPPTRNASLGSNGRLRRVTADLARPSEARFEQPPRPAQGPKPGHNAPKSARNRSCEDAGFMHVYR